jgi:endogenous inhibitor of DNA gyrase (YacG/DUF329 family)
VEAMAGHAKKKIALRCPICKKPVAKAGEAFPFCSERCRTIDLGRWASGAYVIPTPIEDIEKEDDVIGQALRRDDESSDDE